MGKKGYYNSTRRSMAELRIRITELENKILDLEQDKKKLIKENTELRNYVESSMQ